MKRGRRGKQHSSPKGSRGVVEGGGAEEVGEHQVGKRSRREEAAAASRAKRNRTELQDAKEAPGWLRWGVGRHLSITSSSSSSSSSSLCCAPFTGAPQQEPAQLAQPQATTQAPKVMGTLVSQSAQVRVGNHCDQHPCSRHPCSQHPCVSTTTHTQPILMHNLMQPPPPRTSSTAAQSVPQGAARVCGSRCNVPRHPRGPQDT